MRLKMGLLLFLISMIPLLAFSIVIYRNSFDTIRKNTQKRLMVESLLKEYHLKSWIEDNKRNLREFSRRPLIHGFSKQLTDSNITPEEYLSIQQEIRIRHFLPNIDEEKKFLEMFLLDVDSGLIMVSSNSRNEGMFREKTPYFNEGSQETYIQNVYFSMIMEGPAMTLATPVFDETNSLVSVLAARLNLNELTTIMQSGIEKDSSVETYLINQFSFFITESRFVADTLLTKSLNTLASDELQSRISGFGEYTDYRGISVYGVYRWIEDLNLGIITEIDSSEVLKSLRNIGTLIISISTSLMIVVLLMTLLFSRTIINPLKQLVLGVEEVGKGNLDYKISIEVTDEIGQLAKSFNLMTNNLKNITASRDELNREVSERKRFEEELIISREKAETANMSKSLFLSNMSHEIRTPLNAIIGFTDLLLVNEEDIEKRKKMKILFDSGHHLLDLINDILDFSKIEAGKIVIENINFSIRELLNNVKESFLVQIQEKNLDFKLIIHPEGPEYVFGDKHRIFQVLLNLISNSIKFTESGNITLSYRYENNKVLLSVMDTGIGIPLEMHEKIFNVFEQSDSSITRQYGGTGLGLSISNNLIELMGGTMTLESSVGRGSIFTITLPLNQSDQKWIEEEELKEFSKSLVIKWFDSFSGDRDIMRVAFEALHRLPERVKSLKSAILDDNIKRIQYLSHDIKGETGNLGFTEIYDMLKTLEEESKAKKPDKARINEIYSSIESLVIHIPDEYNEKLFIPSFSDSEKNEKFFVLIAEDNSVNRRLMEYYINSIGISYDFAENGQVVLNMLNEKEYDLLLLDIQMPVLDGLEVIKRIRDDEYYKDLYVIALTANAMEGDAEFYIKSGCDDYLSKPVDKNLLLEKINNQLYKKHREL